MDNLRGEKVNRGLDKTEVARFSSPRDNTQNSKTKQSGGTEMELKQGARDK